MALAESSYVMIIQEFPLVWRWTDARYAVFPPEVLDQLRPCSPNDASRLFERAVALSRPDDPTSRRTSAEAPKEQLSDWLQAQQPSLSEEVVVSWSADTALRTLWSTFIERWDDFCYPSSDDVTVLPQNGSWILMYHHWHEFEFRHRTAANKTNERTGTPL